MNYDFVFAIILYAAIFVFFILNKKKFRVQGKIMLLYPTKIGLNLMDKISKISPKVLKALGYVGITLGFAGMAFVFYTLIDGAYKTMFVPKALPTLAPVLPGISVPGIPPLSFWHWIIAILITASVHEFFHGVFARLYHIKIKSSGFALFGPILAAFVEPEEEKLKKIRYRKQLAIFSAGPFANMITAFIFLLILNFATGPIQGGMFEAQGIKVNEVLAGYPAQQNGMVAPFTIIAIDGEETLSATNFTKITADLKPNQTIMIDTDNGTYLVTTTQNPDNASRGFIGVGSLEQKIGVKSSVEKTYGKFLPQALMWTNMLILWLFVINLGIGVFNLLPLGPVDGGRMFYVTALWAFKNNKKAMKAWALASFICLSLIIINLLPWLMKLLTFLQSILVLL